jgi:hypothetical protein
MTAPEPSRTVAWNWIKTHSFFVAGAAALLVVAVLFCLRRQSEWEDVYLRAAAHLWKGEDVYGPGENYLYPPFMAGMAIPFLALAGPIGRFVWLLVNLACLVGMLRWSWRVAGGSRLDGPGAEARERGAAVLGGLCGVFYLHNCLAHQQTDLVIGAALAGGCLLLVRGRPLLAAVCFGLAAACKCTALLWVPYFLWRGRPAAAACVLAVALGVNLLPDVIRTAPTGRPWLTEYASRFLKPLTASDHYVGSWGSDPVYNQSISGMGQRWCTTRWEWTATDCEVLPRGPLMRPQLLRYGVYGFQLVLLLGVLPVCGRPFRKLAAEPDRQRQALECGIVLSLMLLFSPMSSKAHFGILILPAFCLARAALTSRGRLLGSVLVGSILLGLASNKDPLGEKLYTLSLWYGVVTWQTLLLLGGCLIALHHGTGFVHIPLPCPAPEREKTADRAA